MAAKGPRPSRGYRVVQESFNWQPNEPTGKVKTWMPVVCVCVSNEQQNSGSSCGDFRISPPAPYEGRRLPRLGRGRPGGPKVSDVTIQAYFSPHGGCTGAVVEALRQARNTVKVQAYSFASAPITKALVDAHKRGVRVGEADLRLAAERLFCPVAGIPADLTEPAAES